MIPCTCSARMTCIETRTTPLHVRRRYWCPWCGRRTTTLEVEVKRKRAKKPKSLR